MGMLCKDCKGEVWVLSTGRCGSIIKSCPKCNPQATKRLKGISLINQDEETKALFFDIQRGLFEKKGLTCLIASEEYKLR